MGGEAHAPGISFVLNGSPVRADDYGPHTTLLDFIRARGLTGAKEGCAEGECGACTVLMVKPWGSGSMYVPVNSCLVFLPMVAGQEIVTIEGLAEEGQLVPAQQAMAAAGGSQCGYCTPGFVMSLHAEHCRPGRSELCEIETLSGNLCRCTGYRPIRDAALALGGACFSLPGRLSKPALTVAAITSPGFHRPESLAECVDFLRLHPDATVVAGATDLAVESNLRSRRFPNLISLEATPELKVFRDSEDMVEIGAGLTLSEIDSLWVDSPPVWREWLPLFASPLIRNRATLGGNLATASPIGDGAPLLLALDARVKIAGTGGERVVPLDEFFVGYRKTVLAHGEILVSVLIPKPASAMRFFKVAKRRSDDISTVAACFAIRIDERGRIEHARLAYGGVAATPLRALRAEEALRGLRWNDAAVQVAQDVLARTLHPISDHRGSAPYRLALAQKLLEKFWWEQQSEAAA